ncbi:hypothetical protein [uncultured Thiodictyon sp.]|uniref:hypothetical protein n=1 Tax=uncultured Thiodictyon sp. TaxID=1846217 RepID=UPI0025EBF299|nr:hypothetical protein [uncultured Thiodictyon sp.]
MGILFDKDWKVADPTYSQRFGNYQVFLDSVNQQQVMLALWNAAGHFRHPWTREILDDAASPQGVHDVLVEQGVHQPEDLRQGGFTLHFTMRNDRGRAYHFYVQQNNSGQLSIIEISFMERGSLTSVYYQ